jgi:serine/threonine protein kinase
VPGHASTAGFEPSSRSCYNSVVSSDPRIGTRLGGYRVESFIGRGGMGVVYLAQHEVLQTRAALKVIAPELAQDEDFRQRFLREARLAASLNHPNVIPVFDAGEVEGELYIAMRYVDGTDLATILESEGSLDEVRALSILEKVAGALDDAHDHSLLHRDVKPGNILIGIPAGRRMPDVFLTDFGLVKSMDAQTRLTMTGYFVGTVDYSPPELLLEKEPDGRSDQYSLACVLYECLTGEPPFIRSQYAAVMAAHLSEPPPRVTAKRPDLPSEIDDVIQRGMAKPKEERYARCLDLVDAARLALGPAAPAPPVAPQVPGPAPAPAPRVPKPPPRPIPATPSPEPRVKEPPVPEVTPVPETAPTPVEEKAGDGAPPPADARAPSSEGRTIPLGTAVAFMAGFAVWASALLPWWRGSDFKVPPLSPGLAEEPDRWFGWVLLLLGVALMVLALAAARGSGTNGPRRRGIAIGAGSAVALLSIYGISLGGKLYFSDVTPYLPGLGFLSALVGGGGTVLSASRRLRDQPIPLWRAMVVSSGVIAAISTILPWWSLVDVPALAPAVLMRFFASGHPSSTHSTWVGFAVLVLGLLLVVAGLAADRIGASRLWVLRLGVGVAGAAIVVLAFVGLASGSSQLESVGVPFGGFPLALIALGTVHGSVGPFVAMFAGGLAAATTGGVWLSPDGS